MPGASASGNPVRLAVHGAVDIATAGRLAAAVRAASRAGALPVELDLTGVAHLTSAGVQALHELVDLCGSS